VEAEKSVTYHVQYGESPCDGIHLDTLTLPVPDFSTVLDIMEAGARRADRRYLFEITFTERDGRARYMVDAINNTHNTQSCYWQYHIETLESSGMEQTPRVGISDYVPEKNSRVILRYGMLDPGINVTYAIEYPDMSCNGAMAPPDTLSINIPTRSTALDVMEEAVRKNGTMYSFSTEYVVTNEQNYRHRIKQVGSVVKNDTCVWEPYITPPGEMETELTTSLSNTTIQSGFILTLKFLKGPTTTIITTTSKGSGTKVHIPITSCEVYSCDHLYLETTWSCPRSGYTIHFNLYLQTTSIYFLADMVASVPYIGIV
jgi:hypothetical protein